MLVTARISSSPETRVTGATGPKVSSAWNAAEAGTLFTTVGR